MEITQTSGTFEVPRLLAHPGFSPFPNQHIENLLCYVVRHHGDPGPSMLIKRATATGPVAVRLGDWEGNDVSPGDERHRLHRQVVSLLETPFRRLASFMKEASVPQAQFYFSAGLELVDVRVSLNKFAGPGMLKDVFGRLVTVSEVLKIEVMDRRALDAIGAGSGTYDGDLVLKPSKYRHLELSAGKWAPLWAQVRR